MGDKVSIPIGDCFGKKIFFMYDIICLLLEKYHNTGILRSFSKQELLNAFPWKRTQLSIYLQMAINQEILLNHYRKYLLNIKNPLVRRMWDYFFTPIDLRKKMLYDLEKTTKLIENKNILENEILILKKKNKKCYKSIDINDLKNYKSEINIILSDVGFDNESLLKLCKKNITLLLGFIITC